MQYDGLSNSAEKLADLLRQKNVKIVLAESCTAGRATASLGSIAGISDYLCGSMVVYRDQEKVNWLRISDVGIRLWSSVSAPIATQMAYNILLDTTEADYSASITGHLGPNAPEELDGKVFIGLAWRDQYGDVRLYRVLQRGLTEQERTARLQEAATLLLDQIIECIQTTH